MRARVREAVEVNVVGTLRDATEQDADAIVELNLLCDLAEVGEASTTIDEVHTDLATDGLSSVVIDDPDGGLLGYAWVEHEPGHLKTWGDLVVRPGATGPIAEVLFSWLRKRAAEIGPGLPVHVFARGGNGAKERMYEAAGGTVVRRFYKMAVTLADDATFEIPSLGEGVEIRGVSRTDADLRTMHAVVDVAFLDHYGHESEDYDRWLQHTPNGTCRDLTLWWLATVDGEPAAGLYACEMGPNGYVDTLGTLRAYRGRGLARALLLTSFAEFHRRGIRKITLGVDATNPTGAIALYESVGMTVEHGGRRYELPPSAPSAPASPPL
jgi:mycothiol synthase